MTNCGGCAACSRALGNRRFDHGDRRNTRTCESCGATLHGESPAGLCPACLLTTAIEEGETEEAVNGARIQDYELLNEVARGGMGIVYRARQRVPPRIVALKMILPTNVSSADALQRFRVEAEAAASLEHEGILPIYAVGEYDGAPFYSMKFAEGGTLANRLGQFREKPREAAALVAVVARAVALAHEKGILHRDLKPANVLFDSAGKPYVSDFGLAKWLARESDLTQTFAVLGTPFYMAPEQAIWSHMATAHADVYSMGAILYHLLPGHPPFTGDTPMEVLHRAENQPAPRPRLRNRRIPPDLETICLKCLEKDPKRRYSSALALAEDLEHWLKHEPILARRTGLFARSKKWVQRNPTSALLAGSLLALAAAVGWNIWKSELIRLPATNGIAVLPFENLSPDPDNAYFAVGIQEEILTRLASIADLKVISRTSTQEYESKPRNLRQIAKQLRVANIIEGSVQKAADQVRVNVQLINARTDSHLWAETYDRKLTDVFGVESEIAKGIAESLQAKISGREEQALAVRPTDSPEAYDAYLRGLAYSVKTGLNYADQIAAQSYLKEAVRLDPKFALAWALLSQVDALGYVMLSLQPTPALREEAGQAADTALDLQPDLAEALYAKGWYHYGCLKDYDTAVRYFQRARQLQPNNSQIPEALAYVARRRGEWDRSEAYFNEAERIDPRNVTLLTQHAFSYIFLGRFPEARRKLDQVLDITPNDVDTLAEKALTAQADGDLTRAATLLNPLRPTASAPFALEAQVYQTILERQPARLIRRLKELLAEPDPALGYLNGELRFWLGWAQDLAGDHGAAQESWRQARSELEPFLKEQPDNYALIGDLALTHMGLGDKTAALALAERAIAANPIEKDAMDGPM